MLCTILRVIDTNIMSLFEFDAHVSCLMLLSFEFIFTEKRHRSMSERFFQRHVHYCHARSLLDHHLKAGTLVYALYRSTYYCILEN